MNYYMLAQWRERGVVVESLTVNIAPEEYYAEIVARRGPPDEIVAVSPEGRISYTQAGPG
jgi:hypothetical protein